MPTAIHTVHSMCDYKIIVWVMDSNAYRVRLQNESSQRKFG